MKKTVLNRSLALLLAILLVLPLLASCKKGEEPINLVSDGASDYTIIYSSENKTEREAAQTLRNAIKDATGVTLAFKSDDATKESDLPASAKEIVVGETNRAESKSAIASMRAKDYGITFTNERVVITGGSPAATENAVDHFIATYLKSDAKTVFVYESLNDRKDYAYPLGTLSISGTPITDYVIVYPKDADLITKYMAYNLSDYILANAGYEVKVVSDAAAEKEYELLVGETNRAASRAADGMTLAADQFVLMQSGKKVVMLGESYMVGGAASELVNNYFASKGANVAINATNIPTTAAAKTFTFQTATSAILMIGDGMGQNHINMTKWNGQIEEFYAERLPHKDTCDTGSVSGKELEQIPYTDSAAAATALATGYKTINKYLGMDRNGNPVQNVRELAQSVGAKTAVITSDVITGATPSGFLCHNISRHNTTELESEIKQLEDSGLVDYLFGKSRAELLDPTREGLSLISEGNGKFFAMIEEAYIDKDSHAGSDISVQDRVEIFNETIAYVIGFIMLHPYTALIITADHETGKLTYNEATEKWIFTFEATDGSSNIYEHSNTHAPVYGIGAGVGSLLDGNTTEGSSIDNTDIPKFIASIFGNNSFGDR